MNSTQIGYLAGLLTTSSFIPQIWNSYSIMKYNYNVKDKNKKKITNISIYFMFIIFVGMWFWIYHGLLINKNNPTTRDGDAILFWNFISVFFVSLIIIFTLLT